jgi:hypothetical protein
LNKIRTRIHRVPPHTTSRSFYFDSGITICISKNHNTKNWYATWKRTEGPESSGITAIGVTGVDAIRRLREGLVEKVKARLRGEDKNPDRFRKLAALAQYSWVPPKK